MTQSFEAQELGLVPAENRISAQACFQQTNRRILLPALAIAVAGYAVAFLMLFALGMLSMDIKAVASERPGPAWPVLVYATVIVTCVTPLVLAGIWLWRAAQQWRIWALRNVDNWGDLQRLSEEKSGQKWPRPATPHASAAKLLELRLIEYRDRHNTQ